MRLENNISEEIYKTFPELDTPLHEMELRNFLKEQNDGQVSFLMSFSKKKDYGLDDEIVELSTKKVDKLIIRSEYSENGNDDCNFQVTFGDLLNKRKLYFAGNKEAGLVVLSEGEIEDVNDLKHKIKTSSNNSKIPCYIDKITGLMVIYLTKYQFGVVHHGTGNGNHRDTYTGVVLARVLAEYARNQKSEVVIRDPGELEDEQIISTDILNRGGHTFLKIGEKQLSKELVQFLKKNEILTIDSYREYLAKMSISEKRTKDILWESLPDMTDTDLALILQRTFYDIFKLTCGNTEKSGIVFSPATTFGDYDKKNKHEYFRITREELETSGSVAGLLMEDEKVPVSMLLFRKGRDKEAKYLLVGSGNHPDANKFFRDIDERAGFSGAEIIAEIDASMTVNKNKLVNWMSRNEGYPFNIPIDLKMERINKSEGSIFKYGEQKVESKRELGKIIKKINRDINGGPYCWGQMLTIK